MACCLSADIENTSKHHVLCEAKTFQQARERSSLPWPLEIYPCRMKMKEAGLFIVHNRDGKFITVCLYCKKAFTGWNRQYNPYKVHKILSPTCVFILNAQHIQTPSSPIIEVLPRGEEVPPSPHRMAELPKRTNSFEQWPYGSPHPPTNVLAEAGLFYIGQQTRVECFFCHGQISIFRADDNPMLAHTDQCKYAKHLGEHSQRIPLNIQGSNKIYELIDISKDNIKFYFLRCINASTPGILLSALALLPNEYKLQTSDQILKRLKPSEKLEQKVNWATSSDGPLVHILSDLARNPEDLTTKPADIQRLIADSPISQIDPMNDFAFQCKTCLTADSSPHAVPIKCCHLGLCLNECFSKWMTCVICGYTLGKTIRVRGV